MSAGFRVENDGKRARKVAAGYLNAEAAMGRSPAGIFWKIPENACVKWNCRLYVGPQNILRYI